MNQYNKCKLKVLVTIPLHEEALKRMREIAEVKELPRNLVNSKLELLKIIGDFDGAIIGAVEPFDKEVITAGKKLKVISRFGVGYNNVDVKAAWKRGIYVTVTPVLSDTVADLTFGLIIAITRKIPQAYEYIKNRKWGVESVSFTGIDVYGKTLGIIGLGRIGEAVAKRAKNFDMTCIYYDVVRKKELERKLGIKYLPFRKLLSQSDIITIHIPLTDRTTGLIGEKEFKMMKREAILINTSRGLIVDEDALYKSLKENWIAGAAIDVFSKEPINPDNPLLNLNNIVYTPHIASSTLECRFRMSITSVNNTIRALKGEKPLHCVTS